MDDLLASKRSKNGVEYSARAVPHLSERPSIRRGV